MSAQEIAWRGHAILRDGVDRWRVPRLRGAWPLQRVLRPDAVGSEPGFAVTDVTPGAWRELATTHFGYRAWLDQLLTSADRIAANRLSFFDLQDVALGDPIDWNRDHALGVPAPLTYAPTIDYRDVRVTGDAKVVWEPNRHHQLVVLGRAYRASGERRYAEAVAAQLRGWIAACPFGLGMNWRSPLELGVRLINWVWALDLIRPAGVLDAALETAILRSVYLHLWDITRKYSRGSSANNHVVGEAAGVFIAASYFTQFRAATRWRDEARAILDAELVRQTYADGATREQALGYQLFVMQFFTLAGLVAQRSGQAFLPAYWERLEKMYEFVAAMSEGGPLPLYGDADDGYVLDLGRDEGDLRAWLPVGDVLFEREDLKSKCENYSQCAAWLLGSSGAETFENIAEPSTVRHIVSHSFAESGHYLLQYGHCDADDRISVLFDCGELGYGAIAAHGHADALSFTLRAYGADVLVDPGTYDYFTHPQYRQYFRSTAAHNTIGVDGQDQSVMTGSFMWARRATARCLSWRPSLTGGRVVGEHDGYTRLSDPVVHRRTLDLNGEARTLRVVDELRARARHDIALHLHFAEHCRVQALGGNRFEIDAGGGVVTLELDPRLEIALLRGSEAPIAGWVSRGYHRKQPCVTLVGRCELHGDLTLESRLLVGEPRADAETPMRIVRAPVGVGTKNKARGRR